MGLVLTKNMTIKKFEEKFDEFINEIMCRRESNQHKAWFLYNKYLKDLISNDIHRALRSEHSEYWHTQLLTPEAFGEYLKAVKIKAINDYKKQHESN